MSKAEELASKEWSDLGFCNNEQSNAFKLGYLKGYHQAEKDLELTWEDMECIIKHYQDIMAEKSRVLVRAEDYKEVLKRFKDLKK